MHALTRLLAAGLCAAAAASAVQAQTAGNSGPSAAARAAFAAPNPAGLRPVFPAGISSGSGAAVARDPIARSASPIPANTASTNGTVNPGLTTGVIGVPSELAPSEAAAAVPNTAILGAGATVPGPSQYITDSGAGGYAAADLARSFFFADANHDGDLTRAEARRLSIAPQSFEQMDRNFNGLISRFEYEDATR